MPSKSYGNLVQVANRIDTLGREAIYQGTVDSGNAMRDYYRQVVADWSNEPDWRVLGSWQGVARLLLTVETIGDFADIWQYVDLGTDPHIIRPKVPGGKLHFRAGYSARTAPVAQFAVGSGRATGQHVSKDFVLHPGNEPREFTTEARRRLVGFLPRFIHQRMTVAFGRL